MKLALVTFGIVVAAGACTKQLALGGGGASGASGAGANGDGPSGAEVGGAGSTPRERQTVRESQEQFQSGLAAKVSPCGTTLTIDMTWDRFDFASWHAAVDAARKASVGTAVPHSMCLEDVLGDALGYLCGFPEGKDIQPELKKLTKLRCIYKPCDQLPRSVPGQTSPDPGPTLGYALADGGATLEVSYCPKVSVAGSYSARYFVKKAYGL